VFPTSTLSVTDPLPATVTTDILQAVDGTGTIDLVTHAATFDADLVLTVKALTVNGSNIPVGECSFTFTLALTGMWDEATNKLALGNPDFAMSANPADAAPHCGPLGAQIDPVISAGPNSIDAVMDLSITNATPPTPTPVPTPTPTPAPAPAPAPVPVAAAPFTG
jgi:hypothetical protein